MGQKLYRKPEELRLNEEVYHNYLNFLLDSGRFEDAHKLSIEYKERGLTSVRLVEIIVFDGNPIGTGIEDETVKEDEEEAQFLAQVRSIDDVVNTQQHRVGTPLLGHSIQNIYYIEFASAEGLDEIDYESEEESLTSDFIGVLDNVILELAEKEITLDDALSFLYGEIIFFEDYLYGEDE